MTPAGIEPTTFRFVAQHLNHCDTASCWLYSAKVIGTFRDCANMPKTSPYCSVFVVTQYNSDPTRLCLGPSLLNQTVGNFWQKREVERWHWVTSMWQLATIPTTPPSSPPSSPLKACFRPYCGESLRRRWHFTFPAMIQTADFLCSLFYACFNGISEIILEFKSSSHPSVVCRRNQVVSMRNLNFYDVSVTVCRLQFVFVIWTGLKMYV